MATARQSFANFGLPKLMQLGCIEASWKTSTAAMGRVLGVLDYYGIQVNTHTLSKVPRKKRKMHQRSIPYYANIAF